MFAISSCFEFIFFSTNLFIKIEIWNFLFVCLFLFLFCFCFCFWGLEWGWVLGWYASSWPFLERKIIWHGPCLKWYTNNRNNCPYHIYTIYLVSAATIICPIKIWDRTYFSINTQFLFDFVFNLLLYNMCCFLHCKCFKQQHDNIETNFVFDEYGFRVSAVDAIFTEKHSYSVKIN